MHSYRPVKKWLCRRGLFSRGVALLTSAGILSWSAATMVKFSAKFPQEEEAEEAVVEGKDRTPIDVSADNVIAAIKSFRKGSAAGPSGWSPDVLKALCGLPARGQRMAAVFRRILIAYQSSEGVLRAILFGGRGVPLKKTSKEKLTDAQADVRPIVVPDTFRRVLAKAVMREHAKEIEAAMVSHHQCGVLLKRGAEIITHSIRVAQLADPTLVVLKVDCSNAFNSVSRYAMRNAVNMHLPQLNKYMFQAYGRPSTIVCEEGSITSTTGGFQGDPLMPTLFSAALFPVDEALGLAGLTARFWYLDDFIALGTRECVLKALKVLAAELPKIGIHLNWSKSATYSASKTRICEELSHKANGELVVLGTATGANQAFIETVTEYTGEVEVLRGRFQEIDAQIAFCLLRECANANKVSHLMRTCPPGQVSAECFGKFDKAVLDALQDIMGAPLNNAATTQCWLPIKAGGLGLRSATKISPLAFVAGACDVSETYERVQGSALPPDPEFEAARQKLAEGMGSEIPSSKLQQHELAVLWDLRCATGWREQLDDAGQARQLSLKGNEGGSNAWLLLDPAGDAALQPDEFAAALRFTLGLPVFGPGQCPDCTKESDALGMHALNCQYGSNRNSRHNKLYEVF